MLDLFAGLVAVGLLVLVSAHGAGLPRLLLTLVFALFVPGRAIVSNWPRMALWSGAAMPIVFSLAIVTLLAMVTLWAGAWHPLSLFQGEAWLSIGGLCVGAVRRRGLQRRTGPGARQPKPSRRRSEGEARRGQDGARPRGAGRQEARARHRAARRK